MKLNHIVVASNLSPAARQSYPHAASLARTFGAKVTLLHADDLDHGYHDHTALAAYLDTARTVRAERIRQAEADFARLGVDVKVEMVPGSLKNIFAGWVEANQPDLVVMVKRNRGRLEQLLLGSTTKRVLRLGVCPVLVVHQCDTDPEEPPAELPQYRHVLTATDLGPTSRPGLRAVSALAQRLDARVTAVQVVRLPTLHPVTDSEQALALPGDEIDVLKERYDQGLRRELEAVGDGRFWPMVIVGGNPGDGIVEAAAIEKADLIALPATGRDSLGELLLGSTAERVAKRSKVPVLVIPRPFLEIWAGEAA